MGGEQEQREAQCIMGKLSADSGYGSSAQVQAETGSEGWTKDLVLVPPKISYLSYI